MCVCVCVCVYVLLMHFGLLCVIVVKWTSITKLAATPYTIITTLLLVPSHASGDGAVLKLTLHICNILPFGIYAMT